MNRIVLIGNGFDLAHGLPTRYEDFIKDYWEGFMNHCIYQDVVNICGRYEYDCFELYIPQQGLTLSDFLPNGENPLNNPNKKSISFIKLNEKFNIYNEKYIEDSQQIKFNIGNKFLLHLLDKYNKELNWVDIENEYYKFLIYQFDKSKNTGYYYGNINTLNVDYQHIKEILNNYLSKVINETVVQKLEKIRRIVYSQFSLKDFVEIAQNEITDKELNKILSYLDKNNDPDYLSISNKTKKWVDSFWSEYGDYDFEFLKSKLLVDKISKMNFDLQPDQVIFLNFNYTNLETIYHKKTRDITETIHIHGELNNPNNPMIFGYGDELEENYSRLENLQDNAYLENIKSIKYQETDNYKKMLSFINSDNYQVIILGHSCGNSDRTLLNTLFEHENCVSIKPYYYQYKDEKTGEIKDNYSDIVRNISRSFTDKKSMRDKVVNKTYTDWFSQKLD